MFIVGLLFCFEQISLEQTERRQDKNIRVNDTISFGMYQWNLDN